MLQRITPILLLLAVPVFMALPICRYTVRDVGFVVLNEQPYVLRIGRSGAKNKERLANYCRAFFLDADVSLEWAEGSSATLLDSVGRSLSLHGWPQGAVALSKMQDHLDAVIDSSARDQVIAQIIENHGVVVFAEGESVADNKRVVSLCEEAIEGTQMALAELPKKAKRAPSLVRIPKSDRKAERAFLFSIGFDSNQIDSSDPLVAVLYGRGTLMGEPLFGPLITRTQIEENLVLIGQDCECDLERSVMRGRRSLLNWGDEQRQSAQKTLDFDPESPLVRAEVSRILTRGRYAEDSNELDSDNSEDESSSLPRIDSTASDGPLEIEARDFSIVYYLLGAFAGILALGAGWLFLRRGSAV